MFFGVFFTCSGHWIKLSWSTTLKDLVEQLTPELSNEDVNKPTAIGKWWLRIKYMHLYSSLPQSI